MTRISWNEYFLNIAEMVSTRATCPRASVGCVIVNPFDHTIVSTGYNGAPAGAVHCGDVGCTMRDGHCLLAVHAEDNAVQQAKRKDLSTAGCVAYIVKLNADGVSVDESPLYACSHCKQMMNDAGILNIITRDLEIKHGNI